MGKETKKEKSEDEVKKQCFFITPIGDKNTSIRNMTDGLFDSILNPVLEDFNYDVTSSHKIDQPGSITNQIINKLINDDLVIANLTYLNPNVMYELAVRHAAKKPVIVIAEEGTELPFDVNDERTIFFSNEIAGVKELKNQLIRTLSKIDIDTGDDNPIYRAIKINKLLHDPGSTDLTRIILQKFKSLEDRISWNQKIVSNNMFFTNIELINDNLEYINEFILEFSEYLLNEENKHNTLELRFYSDSKTADLIKSKAKLYFKNKIVYISTS